MKLFKKTASKLPKSKILIVDNYPELAEVLALNLEEEHREITFLTDPLIALEMISNGSKFDLIISDYKMNTVNGLEFLRTAKKMIYTEGLIMSGALDCKFTKIRNSEFDYFIKGDFSMEDLRSYVSKFETRISRHNKSISI